MEKSIFSVMGRRILQSCFASASYVMSRGLIHTVYREAPMHVHLSPTLSMIDEATTTQQLTLAREESSSQRHPRRQLLRILLSTSTRGKNEHHIRVMGSCEMCMLCSKESTQMRCRRCSCRHLRVAAQCALASIKLHSTEPRVLC